LSNPISDYDYAIQNRSFQNGQYWSVIVGAANSVFPITTAADTTYAFIIIEDADGKQADMYEWGAAIFGNPASGFTAGITSLARRMLIPPKGQVLLTNCSVSVLSFPTQKEAVDAL
jgi:hypothetical protein